MQIRMRRAMEIKNEKTGDVQFVNSRLELGFVPLQWFLWYPVVF